MGKRPTGKKRFLMIIFTAPIIWPNHFSHSEEEILEMVREVSDDKKNDSLEFNEFLKVRLLFINYDDDCVCGDDDYGDDGVCGECDL